MAGGMTCFEHLTIRELLVTSGSISLAATGRMPMAMVFVGHDWAEAHQDVHVEDEQAKKLAKARLPEGVEGVARFHELIAGFVEDPSEVVVATETDRGLFIGALVAAGYTVLGVRTAFRPLATGKGIQPRVRNPTLEMLWCWRSWLGPIGTTIGRWLGTAIWPRR